MVYENVIRTNQSIGYTCMIYLFDNCYLSTPNNIIETAKHVWIGNHPNMDDPNLDYSFDICRTYNSITAVELEELFEYIHATLADKKTIIYCDSENFQYVYSTFFNGVMNRDAVVEMYTYDSKKENFGIGDSVYGIVVANPRSVNRVELPEQLQWTNASSSFASSLPNQRVELEFATAIQGDVSSLAFCVDRVDQMYDGTKGFWVKYAEQTIPGIMTDEEYTIENLLDGEYVESYVNQFQSEEFIPNDIVPIVKEKFGFDFHKHFFTVLANDNNYDQFLAPIFEMTKREFLEKRILDPNISVNYQLIFPDLSNFDSVNPIFWNAILQNRNNISWLAKYKVTHGTDNKTN